MDPRQKRKANKRIEIVREGGSMRKMRLSDIMSESFSKYLMELDGDFIAPTGDRLSRIEEVTRDAIATLAHKKSQERTARGENPDPKADWLESEKELQDQEDSAPEAASAAAKEREAALYPDTVQGTPTVSGAAAQTPAAPVIVDDDEPAAPSTTQPPPAAGGDGAQDVDDAAGSPPSGGDSNTAQDPDSTEGGPDVVKPNDQRPGGVDPLDADQIDDIQDTDPSSDDSNKDLGGPDEFDEKNRAFTNYIDSLIKNKTGVSTEDSLPAVSERAGRGRRSLVEAVYGSQKIEIVDYKLSR